MKKTFSLKELPNSYIKLGMNIDELSEYLNISKNTLQTWERFFHLFPENPGEDTEYYSRKKVEDFIRIKRLFDKGRSLKEIKESLFRNPFASAEGIEEFNIDKVMSLCSEKEKKLVRPFITQINRLNEKVCELIIEKAKVIEDTAVEKADLMSRLEDLRTRNKELSDEKEVLEKSVQEKEEELKISSTHKMKLLEALKVSKGLLEDKDKELNILKDKISEFEAEIEKKNDTIKAQEEELNRLLEEKNRIRWWQFWRHFTK